MVAQIVARFSCLDVAIDGAAIDIEHEPLERCSQEMFDDSSPPSSA